MPKRKHLSIANGDTKIHSGQYACVVYSTQHNIHKLRIDAQDKVAGQRAFHARRDSRIHTGLVQVCHVHHAP